MSSLALCSVLRCAGDPAGTVTLANPVGPTCKQSPMQALVCAVHKAQIDSGLPYKYEPDVERGHGSILMGDDFDAAGIMITDVVDRRDHPYDRHPDGGQTVTVVVERLNGDGSREQVQLFFSEDLINKVRCP